MAALDAAPLAVPGETLATRQESRVQRAVRQEQCDGLRLAFALRFGAMVPVGLYVLLRDASLVNFGALAALLALGWGQYRLALSRWDHPALMALFPVGDTLVLVGLLHLPAEQMFGLPRTIIQFERPFSWLLLPLILYNLAYRPWLAAWGGIVMGLGWLAGLAWVLAAPGAYAHWQIDPETLRAGGPDALLRVLTDPRFVHVEVWLREAAMLMVVGLLMAVMVRRSQDLIGRAIKAERARANLARYFSPGMVDWLAGRDLALDRPRRSDAAVVFVDIVGFTRMAAAMTPEQVIELLRAFHARMAATVFAHDGTLDKYIGDAVMATFGTPEPGPADAARALACCRAMAAALDAWNAERAGRGEPAVKAGIGAHYGPVVMGDIGDERRLEFAVLGDTVNLASRLEELTRTLDAAIVVSDALAAAARGQAPDGAALLADFEGPAPQRLPGLARIVEVWTWRPPA